MTRRLLAKWLLTLPILPLFAASANASSITCYGSIVITTLGTEGMAINVPDGAIIQPTDPGAGTGFTLDAGSGATIQPLTPKPKPDMAPTSSPGGSGGSGGSNGGSTSPVATAATPAPEIIEGAIPVPNPPSVEVEGGPAWPIEDPNTPPPHKVDEPGMATTNPNLPIEPVLNEVLTEGNGVNNTPEPATLTLLGLAGVGSWVKLRRRK